MLMTAVIRLANEGDAEPIQSIYAPFCGPDSIVSFEMGAPSVDEVRRRISSTLQRYPWLVIDDGGTVLGYSYASVHNERAAYRWSVNTAIYVRHGQQRRGMGGALYDSLFAALRLQGFVNAYAGITLPNEPSVWLHRALGFEEVGVYRSVGFKAGAWRDVAWWQLALRDREGQPGSTTDLPDIVNSAGWDEAIATGTPRLRD